MQHRFIASRLRLPGILVPAIIAATGAFATSASAATTMPTIYTATDVPSLQADVSAADSAAPGTLSIINLSSGQYDVTSTLPLDGNIEITGPPTLTAMESTDAVISGDALINNNPGVGNTPPLFDVQAGSNALLKGIDIEGGGNGQGIGGGTAAIQIDNGGNVEVDNDGIEGSNGTVVVINPGGNLNMTNTDVVGNDEDGIESQGTGTLINDTFQGNAIGALEGSGLQTYNTLFDKNTGAGGAECIGTSSDTFAGDYSNDTTNKTCGTTGVTYSTLVKTDTNLPAFNGGPTVSNSLKNGNPAIGKGIAADCPTADQRFFLYTGGPGNKCDVGSYQTTGTQDTSTSGPVCTVASTTESTDATVPSTETVNARESSGIGLGPDAVNYTITNNGTVGYPVDGTTWFNATDPSLTIQPDYPALGAYPVTATKPVGDLTTGDTNWSFYASDWLGNTTYCN